MIKLPKYLHIWHDDNNANNSNILVAIIKKLVYQASYCLYNDYTRNRIQHCLYTNYENRKSNYYLHAIKSYDFNTIDNEREYIDNNEEQTIVIKNQTVKLIPTIKYYLYNNKEQIEITDKKIIEKIKKLFYRQLQEGDE